MLRLLESNVFKILPEVTPTYWCSKFNSLFGYVRFQKLVMGFHTTKTLKRITSEKNCQKQEFRVQIFQTSGYIRSSVAAAYPGG